MKGEIHLSRLAIALGIPAFRRDGHRVELENLRAEVAAFQPSKAALELDQKLAAGLAELYKPGDDTFRKGTVEAAEKIIVEVQAKLKELQQARLKQQGQQKGAAPNAEALKAMQATRQRLTKALDGKLATISGDAGKVQLPEQMQPAALRGNGELIRVAIAAGDPNQPAGNGTRAAAIEQDIEALGKQIALLNQRVAEDYAYVGTEAPKALKSFETLLDEFDAKAGGKGKYAGPLAGVVDGLKRQLAGSPISADAVRRQLAACETIAKTARATAGLCWEHPGRGGGTQKRCRNNQADRAALRAFYAAFRVPQGSVRAGLCGAERRARTIKERGRQTGRRRRGGGAAQATAGQAGRVADQDGRCQTQGVAADRR